MSDFESAQKDHRRSTVLTHHTVNLWGSSRAALAADWMAEIAWCPKCIPFSGPSMMTVLAMRLAGA